MTAAVAETIWYVQDNGTSPITVLKPAAFAAGQMLVAVVCMDGGVIGSLTADPGWTEEANNINIAGQDGKVFWRVWAGGEPSTWAFAHDPTGGAALALLRVTQVYLSPAQLVVPAPTTSASNGSTMDSPSVTPAGTNDLLIATFSTFGGGTALSLNWPSGMTTQGQIQATGGFEGMACASEQLAVPGATGVRTWTSIVPTAQKSGAFGFAIKSLDQRDPDPPPNPPPPLIPPWMLRELVAWRQQPTVGDTGPAGNLVRTDLLCQITGATGNFGTGSWVTNSFTPPSNSLLVVAETYIENNGTTTDPTSALAISGGGWTYTGQTSTVSQPTNFPTVTKIWTAPVAVGASMTLTLSAGGRSAGVYSVSVVAYTGYDGVTPVGATATGNQSGGFAGPPTPLTLTLGAAPAVASEVFAGVGTNRSVAGATPGAGWTEDCDTENTDWGGLQTQTRNNSTSTSVDWADLRSGGGALFNYAAAAIEIRSGTGPVSAALFVAQPPRAKRLVVPWPRFGRAVSVVPAQVVIAAPVFVSPPVRARLHPAMGRRLRAATPVPVQTTVPPPVSSRTRVKAAVGRRRTPPTPPPQAAPVTAIRSRLKWLKLPRPRPVQVVPPQVTAAPPTYPPAAVRARQRFPRLTRPGSAMPVPAQVAPAAPLYPPQSTRARLRAFLVRRRPTAAPPLEQLVPPSAVRGRPRPPRQGHARLAAPVPPQTVVTPPSYVPQGIRARMWAGRLFRGRAAMPVPAQATVAAPPYPPQPSRARRGFARLFGGHRATPVPPQVNLTPTFVPGRRQPPLRIGKPSRARLAAPPPAQVVPPLLARVTQRIGQLPRRRSPQAAAQASPVPPSMARLRQRVGQLLRVRPRPVVPPQVFVANPPRAPQSPSARRKLWPLRRRASQPMSASTPATAAGYLSSTTTGSQITPVPSDPSLADTVGGATISSSATTRGSLG